MLVTGSVFAWTVDVRSHWFGKPAHYEHYWLTYQALMHNAYWYREGMASLRYSMVKNPPSIEFPTFEDREPYVSYPLGGLLPIYLIGQLSGHEPTAGTVMGWNLANHLAIAVLMSLVAFFLLRQAQWGHLPAFLTALVPAMLMLLLPGPGYDLQCIYFSDLGVLTWYSALVLLEVLRGGSASPRGRRAIAIAQWIVIFLGTYCEWQFLPISLVLYAARILDGSVGRKGVRAFLVESLVFWSPVAAALALYGGHVLAIGQLDNLFSRYHAMAGTKGQHVIEMETVDGVQRVIGWHKQIWIRYFGERFGWLGIGLFWSSLATGLVAAFHAVWRRVRKQPPRPGLVRLLCLVALLTVPCFMRLAILQEYAYDHHFSVEAFSPATVSLPFVFVPLLIIAMAGGAGPRVRWGITAGVLVTAGMYLALEWPRYTSLFPPDDNPETRMTGGYEKIGRFLRENAKYEDVVFSPVIVIPVDPPQQLYHSRKRVYPLTSLEDVAAKIRPIDDRANVAILLMAKNPDQPLWQVRAAMANLPFEIVESAPFQIESPYQVGGPDGKPLPNQPFTKLILCKIRKDVYLRDYPRLGQVFPLRSPAAEKK